MWGVCTLQVITQVLTVHRYCYHSENLSDTCWVSYHSSDASFWIRTNMNLFLWFSRYSFIRHNTCKPVSYFNFVYVQSSVILVFNNPWRTAKHMYHARHMTGSHGTVFICILLLWAMTPICPCVLLIALFRESHELPFFTSSYCELTPYSSKIPSILWSLYATYIP